MDGVKTAEKPNFERIYWEKARKNFKQGRKEKDDEKKLDDFLKERSTPQEAKELCKATQKKAGNEYSPSLGGILEKIDIAMSVGDLAIKSAPESVGLAWMGIRLCLHSVADDFATFNIFGAACSDIIGIMISCAVFGRMYGPSRGIDAFQEIHVQVTDRIPLIYTEILDFSFSVKKYMGRNKAARLAKGLVSSASAKFGMKIKAIKEHDLAMAEFARRAHEQLSDYYLQNAHETQQEMRGSLDDIKEKLTLSAKVNDEYRQQVGLLLEELSKRKEMTPHDVAMKNFDENMRELNATSDQKTVYNAKIARRSPPQTCTWIFDQEAFTSWYSSDKSDMLWVSGGGGFGKSILMAAVVHELQVRSSDNDAFVQYFFCNAGDDATKRTERILRHILTQVYELVAQHPTETIEKSNKLVSSYLKGNKGAKSGQSESKKEDVSFADAFRGIIDLLRKPAFIMVDALDECTDRTKGLISSLRELMQEPHPTIKVVVCSRPDEDIVTALDKIPTIKVEGNNGPDIRLNAETELAKLPGWTAAERELATSKIVDKAGSYFRYVDLAIGFLKQPWQRPLKKHLEQLPEGLPAFYEQIIKKTDPAYLDLLKTCLTWTILADGKVHVEEIIDVFSRVYAVEEEDTGSLQESESKELSLSAEPEVESDGLYVTQIRTAGSALLEVDPESKVIQLRHNTVADHFLKPPSTAVAVPEENEAAVHCEICRKRESSTGTFTISEKEGHLSIAIAILKHLSNENFRQKYLVPFERRTLKRTFEDQPGGYETDDGTQDDKEPEDTGKESATSIENDATASGDSPDAAQPASEGDIDATNSNEFSQAQPASDESPTTETDTTSQDDPLKATDASPAQTDEDAVSDVASEADSDAGLDEAENVYAGGVEDDHAQLYRYEVNYCAYHLKSVEELYKPEDRTGADWEEFEALRTAFFQSTSPYFRSWVNLINQIRYGSLSWVDDVETIHPVHVAAAYGLTSLVEKLIADGADLAQLTDEGYTPLDFAIEYFGGAEKDRDPWYQNSLDLFKVLLEGGADSNAVPVRQRRAPFYRLFYYRPGLEVVQLFLKNGGDIFKTGSAWKSTILHNFCSVCDNADVLRELLDRGAKLDAVDQLRETPLHSLMQRYDSVPVELIKILLDAGANVNAEDDLSQQPLRELCMYSGSSEAAELLIEAGADVFDEDLSRTTALHTAAENGHAEVVKLLIAKNAKMDVTDDRGCTPLYKACGAKSDDAALYMIEYAGETLDQAAKTGKTPLRKAAARGHRKIVEAIFEKCNHDASVLTSKDTKERTPLHAAAQYARKDVVEYLLEQGVPVMIEDSDGKTPLRACFEGWNEARSKDFEAVCLRLLDAVNIVELHANLLHIAAARGSLPVLSKLMEKGADPLAQDEHGWTSIQIAQHFRQNEAAELLSTKRAVTGFRPSELKNTAPKLLELSEDKLEIKRTSKKMPAAVSIVAQHPIPAGATGFYFEVEIDASEREDESTKEPEVALGLCSNPPTSTRGWLPGWASPTTPAWAYHGDDAGTWAHPSRQHATLARYGHGDVIGCGLNVSKDSIFFTKNGELLEIERPKRVTCYAFTEVRGRLYPVLGTSVCGVRLKVNFGDGGTEFRWGPGNGADCGVGVVEGREEVLGRRVALRRRTTGFNEVVVGDDTMAGAEDSGKIEGQAALVETVA